MQRSKKILLVEDNRLTAAVVRDFLQKNGFETDTVAAGEEVLEKISIGFLPDLILMDIELAGKMDGIEAARRVIETWDIPVVFLTASTSREIIDKIKEVKAYGFVLKGIDQAALLSTVEMALKLHEANLQAKRNEATLSAIMEAARDAIVMLDSRGNVAFCNSAAEQIFGYSKEEVLGKDFHRLVSPDERLYKLYLQGFERFQQAGKDKATGRRMELKARRKDGREIDVELSLSALNIMDGWYAVGIVRDVSERKHREEELECSRRQYLELAENAPIGILKCDKEGNIAYVNQKTLEILGSPSIEETKKINLLTFPLLVKHGLAGKLEECLQKNKSGVFEVKYKSKWGKEAWLRVHIKSLANRNEVTGAQIIIDDITEKKQLEEEKRRKEERFRLMLQGIPSPAWLISRERRILAQNKAAESIFGTKVGDYCWKGIHNGEFLPPELREALKEEGFPLSGAKCSFCLGDEALDLNEPFNSEVEVAGHIWDTRWIPLGEGVFLHYAADVTKYKKMEEELRLLSVTDSLTNVYNRRYFMQKLQEEIERAKRSDREFSLIMLDIDRFKSINDKFGHNAGDLVLKNITELIKSRIRKTDTLARWGGEEFLLLLPDTPVKNAVRLAEELRDNLSRLNIPGIGNVTASFGVAGYRAGDTIDALLQRADDSMYEAKAAGRNCVRRINECVQK